MFYVMEVIENAWGVDEATRGIFNTRAEAETFIAETYGDNTEGIFIDDWSNWEGD